MAKYRLKSKYKDVTIKPGAKEIVLAYLSESQIELLIKAGYDEYFTEIKAPKKEDK